jgi:hypothetical protein
VLQRVEVLLVESFRLRDRLVGSLLRRLCCRLRLAYLLLQCLDSLVAILHLLLQLLDLLLLRSNGIFHVFQLFRNRLCENTGCGQYHERYSQ